MEKTGRKFKHLTWENRIQIETLYRAGYKARAIALQIGCSFKTIYNELKRGEYEHLDGTTWISSKRYSSDKGQIIYNENMSNHGVPLKIGKDFEYANYIEKRIVDDGLTPLAVLGEIKKKNLKFNTTVCVQTLYNYIHHDIFFRLSDKNLIFYHKLKKKEKEKKRQKKAFCGLSIEKRPYYIRERKSFGHWEMDCVESCKRSKETLLCLSERLTRKEILFKMTGKTAENVVSCIDFLEKKYKKSFSDIFKTITVDNGVEFSDCKGIERSIYERKKRTTVYYCHPYCSSERGTNERMNREIRRKYPKGTNFSKVSDRDIKELEKWLNNYPRGVLGYDTPENMFNYYIKQ